MQQAGKVFLHVTQALEAETLQGQTATRVIQASKLLIGAGGLDAGQLIQQLSPETQQTIRAFFG